MASAHHRKGLSDDEFEIVVRRAWATDDKPIVLAAVVPKAKDRIQASVLLAPKVRIDRPSLLSREGCGDREVYEPPIIS